MQQHVNVLQAAPEDELRLALGLQNYTSGKGKVELKDSSMRPIEIFMCSVVSLESPFAMCWQCCCVYSVFMRSECCDVIPCNTLQTVCILAQVRRMGYGEGFRWLSQYIK